MYYIKKYIALILTITTILVCCSCKRNKVDYKDVNDLFNDIINELQTNYDDYQDCQLGTLEIDALKGKKVSFKVLKDDGLYFEGDKKDATGSIIRCPIKIDGVNCYFSVCITTGKLNDRNKFEHDQDAHLKDGDTIIGTICYVGNGECRYDDEKLTSVSAVIYIKPN